MHPLFSVPYETRVCSHRSIEATSPRFESAPSSRIYSQIDQAQSPCDTMLHTRAVSRTAPVCRRKKYSSPRYFLHWTECIRLHSASRQRTAGR